MLTLGSEKHVVSYCIMCSLAFSVRFSSEIHPEILCLYKSANIYKKIVVIS